MDNQATQPNQQQPVQNNPESAESIPPIAPPVIPPDPPVSDNIGDGDEQERNQQSTDYIEKIYDEIKSFTTYYKNTTSSPWNGVTVFTLIISVLALLVSGIVVLQNNKLVDSANTSAIASERSATSSEDAVCQQENSNDISLNSLISTNDANSKNLNAQIQSLQETQKQFQIENKPYLQIGTVFFDSVLPNKPKILIYTIENLGNYPAKTLSMSTTYIISIEDKKRYDINNPPNLGSIDDEGNLNNYIVKGAPLRYESKYGIDDSIILSKEQYNALTNGQLFIYLVGRITYVSLVDVTKKMKYEFMIECDVKRKGTVYKYNENMPCNQFK